MEHWQVPLESFQVQSVCGSPCQELVLNIRELPGGLEGTGVGIPSALDVQRDGMFSAGWVHLYDLTEILLDRVRPFASVYLFGFNFDDYAGGLLRIFLVTREMDVVLRESAPPLAPPAGQGDLERFENRSLARVVRTDEDSSLAQRDVKTPDGTKVLDVKSGYPHSGNFGRTEKVHTTASFLSSL